jgi:hypothetical protein
LSEHRIELGEFAGEACAGWVYACERKLRERRRADRPRRRLPGRFRPPRCESRGGKAPRWSETRPSRCLVNRRGAVVVVRGRAATIDTTCDVGRQVAARVVAAVARVVSAVAPRPETVGSRAGAQLHSKPHIFVCCEPLRREGKESHVQSSDGEDVHAGDRAFRQRILSRSLPTSRELPRIHQSYEFDAARPLDAANSRSPAPASML